MSWSSRSDTSLYRSSYGHEERVAITLKCNQVESQVRDLET